MPTTRQISFAQRLRDIRESQRLSRAKLAARSGIGQVTIYHLEIGIRLPMLRTALQLARALGVSLAEFDDIDADDLVPRGAEKRPLGRPRKRE